MLMENLSKIFQSLPIMMKAYCRNLTVLDMIFIGENTTSWRGLGKNPMIHLLYFGHYSTNYFGHSKKSFNLILFLKDLNEATPKEPYQDIDFHLKSNVN